MQSEINTMSYLDKYNETIAPKLREIDIFLKTKPRALTVKSISNLLYIPEREVLDIINHYNIKALNSCSFFEIMKNGSSDICQLFNRELKRGIPKILTPVDISYIYDIDIDTVLEACKEIGIVEYNHMTLKLLFSNISMV